MKTIRNFFSELSHYPSAFAGLVMIIILFVFSIYTIFALPYDQAISLWRGDENVWYNTPKNAQPTWMNWFLKDDLPETFSFNSANGEGTKTEEFSNDTNKIFISFPFEYNSKDFPQEVSIFFTSKFEQKEPFVSIKVITPDGREIKVGSFTVGKTHSYRFSQDQKLQRRLQGNSPEQGIFMDLTSETEQLTALPGKYEVQIEAVGFEEGSTVDAELIVYGKVYGWAGTDHRRRDIGIALMWGAPIALTFGLLTALGTTITTMIIAAFGTWYGGWIDEVIQRITEINLVLPFLSILIMIGTFYSKSLWVMLVCVIALSIFGGAIKGFRAVFMQIKEAPYVEAARAYGASNMRIIMQYLVPRIVPLLIPQLVILIPSNVFLEASLTLVGLGDPILPTWGKLIYDGVRNGALVQGQYYWVLEPAFILLITGLSFAMVGFSMDRIFNPRLRGV
ncbi:MAG TPA: ABC transporter permease [Anaerolineales bacterium]|nr:ABC transporter permease [Anaerolineales bacterium]HNB35325.1 ABC transporter permease [Anaerolineales bacterium]